MLVFEDGWLGGREAHQVFHRWHVSGLSALSVCRGLNAPIAAVGFEAHTDLSDLGVSMVQELDELLTVLVARYYLLDSFFLTSSSSVGILNLVVLLLVLRKAFATDNFFAAMTHPYLIALLAFCPLLLRLLRSLSPD